MKTHPYKSAQCGAALVVSLILLVMVSLIAAAGYIATTGEARSAAGWSDRQRALYLAESTLQIALVDATILSRAGNVRQAMIDKGVGYYIRGENAFAVLPWNEHTFDTKSVEVTNLAGMAGTSGRYVIVYEGKVATGNTGGVVSSNGGKSTTSQHARFTVYAKAGGQRDGTLVVLSTAQELY